MMAQNCFRTNGKAGVGSECWYTVARTTVRWLMISRG